MFNWDIPEIPEENTKEVSSENYDNESPKRTEDQASVVSTPVLRCNPDRQKRGVPPQRLDL